MTVDLAAFDAAQLNGGWFLPHQHQGITWLVGHPRGVLGDDVGLGKTVQAAGLIGHLSAQQQPPGHPVALWLTDAALIPQTAAELRRFLPSLGTATSIEPRHKTKRPSAKAVREYEARHPNGPDIFVASYEFAHARFESFISLRPAALILDEAMAVKNGGVEHKTARALSRKAGRCIALTATPLENDPTETWHLLDAVGAPGLWQRGAFWEQFVDWADPYQLPNGNWVAAKPKGFKRGMERRFRDYLAGVMLRRTADEVGLRLPSLVGESLRWVPLTQQQRDEYRRAEGTPGLYGHQVRERISRLSRDGRSSSLVDAALAEVRQRPVHQKIVIGAETLDLLALMRDRLAGDGIGFVSIEGVTSAADRADAVARFTADPSIRVFLGSRVLERGLNLQVANVLLSLDSSYNPAREAQREGRIRRIGSPHATYEHITFLPDTRQNRKSKIPSLLGKRHTASSVLSG